MPQYGSVVAMKEFRFSFNVIRIDPAQEFIDTCQRAERCGYDAVFAVDHLGIAAPFPTLVAAAATTEQLRVGTLVLNAPLWNSALLARDIATTDILTGGRLEVGLGAGHTKWEYNHANIPFGSFATRAGQLRKTVDELTCQFTQDGFHQQAQLRQAYSLAALRPIQRRGFKGTGPPLLIGGTGDRVLQLAAEYADIVSITGVYQVKGQAPGTMRIATTSELKRCVQHVRACADQRMGQLELHTLIQAVVRTDNRRDAAEMLARQFGNPMTADEILKSPNFLIGSVEQMARHLRRSSEKYGFTHFTVQQPFVDVFAPVIEHLRSSPRRS